MNRGYPPLWERYSRSFGTRRQDRSFGEGLKTTYQTDSLSPLFSCCSAHTNRSGVVILFVSRRRARAPVFRQLSNSDSELRNLLLNHLFAIPCNPNILLCVRISVCYQRGINKLWQVSDELLLVSKIESGHISQLQIAHFLLVLSFVKCLD